MKLRLVDLPDMHPSLLWDDILAATVAILVRRGGRGPYPVLLECEDIPGHGSGQVTLEIVATGIPESDVVKATRTYEPQRQVELAAIAMAGLALFQAGGHQIRDVALRGTSADYLIDDQRHLLEVAGRSRRSDFQSAWDTRWRRLARRPGTGFYVFVSEFETPTARLGFGT